ncbi:FAD-dependent oxidoreductase [Sphingomonas ginkgonis]|uniref:FAD-dependent oxidoreductase n=1 Tax=Sphingomonas ginkgonis TaxID=2315330 RepID=A0A3R9X870_9SPHN|nr:FAD-dependent oxidoreductase [Sphingomonas ginkgonis]RST31068.1 FAD-dependent oxidoreductase [Sphingomonas ginkgonis]
MNDRDLLIVGGGPAGVMAGYLFARAGVQVTIFEKHQDFFRDFRGDTVHPSTMEILSELGLLDRFLQRPHNRLDRAEIRIAGHDWLVADLSHLDTPAPFVAMMPQWEFLDFLRDEGSRFPGFELEMEKEVSGFLEAEGRIVGVRLADGSERRARLVIAADGRSSLVRKESMLPLQALGAPMDILWFRIPKGHAGNALRGSVEQGRMLVLIDRGDYWQCAFVIPKGKAAEILGRGMEAFRATIREAAADLDVDALKSPEDIRLLSVALDRLTCWHRPGLLAIGDAAHAMSPIGGIGINLAIQDAVAAANFLAGPMAAGEDPDPLLHKVQDKRLLPTRLVQGAQKLAQDRVVGKLIQPGPPLNDAPWLLKLLNRSAPLRRIPGRLIGLGVGRERVRSPAAVQ